MPARSERTRSITRAKSTRGSPASTPQAPAPRTVAATRAEASRALEGTQPKLRQSPPRRRRSTRATFPPSPAAPAAATSPAVPAPMTTRL